MLVSVYFAINFASTKPVAASTPEPESCENLCRGQDYGTVFSIGCCEKQFCHCTNDGDHFVDSCPFGQVFCLDRCVSAILCSTTENCCLVPVRTTTETTSSSSPTTVTPSPCHSLCSGVEDVLVAGHCCSQDYCYCGQGDDNQSLQCGAGEGLCSDQQRCVPDCRLTDGCCQDSGLDCDSLCVGNSEHYVSDDCCTHNYCFCSSVTGNLEIKCEDGTYFCDSRQSCVGECQAGECCGVTTTPPPAETCEELCLTAGEGELEGECCGEHFCLCTSSGDYEVKCPAGQLYCPLLQDCLHDITCQDHTAQCCQGAE